MDIEYRFLNEGYIEEIYRTWMESFADYQVDMSYLTLEKMISRARMDRVDFNFSVGAFYNDKMVGFTNIGIDNWKNSSYAWDAGTGIIPEFRGKGIAGKMFDFALPKLKKNKIKKFALEVIRDNEPAVKAYKKSGFEIVREYNCYKADITNYTCELNTNPDIVIKPVAKDELENYMERVAPAANDVTNRYLSQKKPSQENKISTNNSIEFCDWEISWEYNFSALRNIEEDLLIHGAFIDNKCVGFVVFYPTLEWIFVLAVNREFRRLGIGSVLLHDLIYKIKEKTSIIKFHNLIPGHPICVFLEKHGFEIYTTQYEMERKIS